MKTFNIVYKDYRGEQKIITITAPNRNYAIDQFYDMAIGSFLYIQQITMKYQLKINQASILQYNNQMNCNLDLKDAAIIAVLISIIESGKPNIGSFVSRVYLSV